MSDEGWMVYISRNIYISRKRRHSILGFIKKNKYEVWGLRQWGRLVRSGGMAGCVQRWATWEFVPVSYQRWRRTHSF